MKCFYKGYGYFTWTGLFFYLLLFFPIILHGQDEAMHWKIFSIGLPVMHINLPGEAVPMEVTVSPSLLQVIHSYSAYQYIDTNIGMRVMIVYISYHNSDSTEINHIREQFISDLQKAGASTIKYKSSLVDFQGRQGLYQQGTLEFNGIKKIFSNYIIEEGSNVWKVALYANRKGRKGKQTLETIGNSINFNIKE